MRASKKPIEIVLSQLQHKCSHCKQSYTKNVSWNDPARFSKDSQPTTTFALLCPNPDCSLPTVLLLRHLPGKKVEVAEILPSTTAYSWPR